MFTLQVHPPPLFTTTQHHHHHHPAPHPHPILSSSSSPSPLYHTHTHTHTQLPADASCVCSPSAGANLQAPSQTPGPCLISDFTTWHPYHPTANPAHSTLHSLRRLSSPLLSSPLRPPTSQPASPPRHPPLQLYSNTQTHSDTTGMFRPSGLSRRHRGCLLEAKLISFSYLSIRQTETSLVQMSPRQRYALNSHYSAFNKLNQHEINNFWSWE